MKRTLSDWKIHTVAFKKGAIRLLFISPYIQSRTHAPLSSSHT